MKIKTIGLYTAQNGMTVWCGETENAFFYAMVDTKHPYSVKPSVMSCNDFSTMFRFSQPFSTLEEAKELPSISIAPCDGFPNGIVPHLRREIEKEIKHLSSPNDFKNYDLEGSTELL